MPRPEFGDIVKRALRAFEQGELKLAKALVQTALAQSPHDPQLVYFMGRIAERMGATQIALEHFERAIALDSRRPTYHAGRGRTCTALGKMEAAERSYRTALRLEPGAQAACEGLAALYRSQGKPRLAMECYRAFMRAQPDAIWPYSRVAHFLLREGKSDQALAAIDQALAIRPVAALYCNKGNILSSLGEVQAAIECYRKAISLDQSSAAAYLRLVELEDRQGRERLIGPLTSLAQGQTAPGPLADCHFALGKILEGKEEYGAAFEHYRIGNEHRKLCPDQRVDMDGYRRRMQSVVESFDKCFFEETGPCGITGDVPVFVVGFPRSGTSLVEQIISVHPQAFGAGELEDIGNMTEAFLREAGNRSLAALMTGQEPDAVREKAQNYLARVDALSGGTRRVVDKMPHNFENLWLLYLMFTRPRIIHCRRNPVDTCLSCYFTAFGSGHGYANDLTILGTCYRIYRRVMEHWEAVLPCEVLTVDYEELVTDQERVTRKMLEFCELPWDDACLAFHRSRRAVSTASRTQVREKMHTRSVGRWRHYRENLGPLVETLGREYAAEAWGSEEGV